MRVQRHPENRTLDIHGIAKPEPICVCNWVAGFRRGTSATGHTKSTSQKKFLHLARGVHRQRIENHDLTRHFVIRHILAAPADDLFGGGTRAGAQDDIGLGHLAEPFVGHPDHRRLHDRRNA